MASTNGRLCLCLGLVRGRAVVVGSHLIANPHAEL